MSFKEKLLSPSDQKNLVKRMEKSKKYHLITLLLLDCGLRVSECVTLRVKSFDLVKDLVRLQSLKKRGKTDIREIPLTDRVRTSFIVYYGSLKNKSQDSYLFPSSVERGHLDRRRVYRKIKLETNQKYSPHDLRHTFASRLVNEGSSIRVAQSLLGHKSYRTTEIYLHVDQQEEREAIRRIQKLSFVERLKKRFVGDQVNRNLIIHADDVEINSTYGRGQELKQIHTLFENRINTLVVGPQGIGKSHLLDLVKGDKVLRLDDLKVLKKTIGNLLIAVSQKGKEDLAQLLIKNADLNKVITRESTKRLVELLVQLTDKGEFTLIIDDMTDITKSGVRVIEQLKNHFHIIAAARAVKIQYLSMITNFEKIEIKPLNRFDSNLMIDSLSDSFYKRIQDYTVFRDHVFEQSGGNPLFLFEMMQRFSKEKVIDVSTIREVKHTAAVRDIDMSLFFVLALSSLMILRYVGSETDDSAGAFRLFGGVFLLFALFARPILNLTKKKFV